VLGIDCNMKGKWNFLFFYVMTLVMCFIGYFRVGDEVFPFTIVMLVMVGCMEAGNDLVKSQRDLIDLQDRIIRSNYERK